MWTETLRPLKNVSTQAPFRTFGTSWLSRRNPKTAGRFSPNVKRNAEPSPIFGNHAAHQIAIVIGPASGRRTLITMDFSAVSVSLRHGKTALREMMTDPMQPLVQPDFTVCFVPPRRPRCVRNCSVGRIVAPVTGTEG